MTKKSSRGMLEFKVIAEVFYIGIIRQRNIDHNSQEENGNGWNGGYVKEPCYTDYPLPPKEF